LTEFCGDRCEWQIIRNLPGSRWRVGGNLSTPFRCPKWYAVLLVRQRLSPKDVSRPVANRRRVGLQSRARSHEFVAALLLHGVAIAASTRVDAVVQSTQSHWVLMPLDYSMGVTVCLSCVVCLSLSCLALQCSTTHAGIFCPLCVRLCCRSCVPLVLRVFYLRLCVLLCFP
jgi:hypothetical protein